ncbi:MAG: FecR domain-containing protein [Xenophilus sp.]
MAPSDDALAEQAAQWIVRLTDGDEAERRRARSEFEAWKRADPRHAAAARGMEGFVGQVHAVRDRAAGQTRPARAALDASFAEGRRRQRVRTIGTVLTVACLLTVPGWMLLRAWPASYLLADMRTATGQWETRTLADGTHITLNSASAVNLRYDARRRVVELVQGEILVDVAGDASRPFVVETVDGSIQALGTRFVVDRQAGATVLEMIASRTLVRTAVQLAAGDGPAVAVGAGERVRITRNAVTPAGAVDPRTLSDVWQRHQLVASDQPLPDVLDELSRHRPGRIQYDRGQLQGIHVNAVLPLDDTDRALKLLMTSFPELRIRTVTPWLVLVDAPPRR